MIRRIPLEQIRIPEPCHEDWDGMSGDAQRRFCGACKKHVHDFSKMTRSAAEELVCRQAGNLCIQLQRDVSGTVVTLDYAKPVVRRKWPFRIAMAGLMACVAATSSFVRKPVPAVRMMEKGKMVAPQRAMPPVIASTSGGIAL